MSTMTAAVLHGPSDLRVEAYPVPAPPPGWVVLKVEEAGICGTDLAVYRGTHPAALPVVLGHEFSGQVAAVGEGVTGIQEGQRVAAQGGWPCGVCDQCIAGRTGKCRSRALLGRTIDGCFADQVAVHAAALHPLPAGVTPRAAQAMTTLATALHAADRAGALEGRRVAIVGAGHAGLLLLQVCMLRGAAQVTVVGTRANRLEMARQLGAIEVVNIRTTDFTAWLADTGRSSFDVTFEASGTTSGLAQAVRMTGTGGTVVAYGILHGTLDGVPARDLYSKEIAIVGSRGAGNQYAEALRLLARGAVRTDLLVTHVLPLEGVQRGITLMAERPDETFRVVLKPNGEERSP